MFKIQNSDFIVDRLTIEASTINYVEEESDPNAEIQSNNINIDFIILESDDNKFYKIVMHIKSPKRLVNGYRFGCVGEGVFSFRKEVNENFKKEFIKVNGVSFLIAHIRSYLMNMTSYSSGPSFILPAVDLPNLLNKYETKQKREESKLINKLNSSEHNKSEEVKNKEAGN